jgi:hypothetical protein
MLGSLERSNLNHWTTHVKVKVTLQLTVSQLVRLGVEPHLELMTRYFFIYFCESCGPVNFGAEALSYMNT